MTHVVRCEECHRPMDRDEAHDFVDESNVLHYWCADCCPVCELSDDGCEIV